MLVHHKSVFFLTGLMSGFALLISGNTLNFWLADAGVDIKSIGLFALVSLPYALSFLWAPIFDLVKVPIISVVNTRNNWLYILQFMMVILTILLSMQDIEGSLVPIAFVSLMIAFCSSSQDLILGKIRANLVGENMQGSLSGLYIFGYRIGMLISSSGAIALSKYLDWSFIYKIIALVIAAFPIITSYMSSVQAKEDSGQECNMLVKIGFFEGLRSVIKPIGAMYFIVFILCFLVLYRLPDNMINVMINPFLLHLGFDAFEIASAGKFLGVTSAIIGGFLGSYVMTKAGIYKGLLWFGIVHALAHLLFIIQLAVGDNILILFVVMGFESITGGMAMAAYMAYITLLSRGEYGATRYAILTSMMGFSRSIFASMAGFIVILCGWKMFFIFNFILSLPAILMLIVMKPELRK